MKAEREYILPLAGLSTGLKHYVFKLDKAFFEKEAYEEASNGLVQVDLELDKRDNMIELNFHISGWLKVICDRCGDLFQQQIENHEQLILKFGDHYEEESEEVIVIPTDLHEFDVYQLLYEYTILALPIQKIHPRDADGNSSCNPEALERLKNISEQEETDPRWEALKKLKR